MMPNLKQYIVGYILSQIFDIIQSSGNFCKNIIFLQADANVTMESGNVIC